MKRLAVLTFMAFALLVSALPAHGCSCAMRTPAEMAASAPVAFVGTVVDTGGVVMTGNRTMTFNVETVFSGEVPAVTEVVTASNSAACGIEAPLGARVAVFGEESAGYLTSNLCSTIEADAAIAALGPGTPPSNETTGASFDWQLVWLGLGAIGLVGGVWLVGRRRL